ncbi:hypothetical protein [Niabella hirudinis]|uniref:hypothetical protein n=1 Tax=Niabella hirudinis TaxID=1285929 RepID=UPI003EB96819
MDAEAAVVWAAVVAGAGVAGAGALQAGNGRAVFYRIFYDAAFWVCNDVVHEAPADAEVLAVAVAQTK